METVLEVIAVVAFLIFIGYNIFEIVMTNKFYKKMEKQHKAVIDKLINDTVEEMLGDKDENN